jgi:hypothetical protein
MNNYGLSRCPQSSFLYLKTFLQRLAGSYSFILLTDVHVFYQNSTSRKSWFKSMHLAGLVV